MYVVSLLIERELADLDADQVVALHEGIDDEVTYQVVLPVKHIPAVLAGSLGALGGVSVPVTDDDTLVEAVEQAHETGQSELDRSVALLQARGQQAFGTLTDDDPVRALGQIVTDHDAAEAIILTAPHVVSEFFHVDWTSRARRSLDVPTLHLLEHLPFAAQ